MLDPRRAMVKFLNLTPPNRYLQGAGDDRLLEMEA